MVFREYCLRCRLSFFLDLGLLHALCGQIFLTFDGCQIFPNLGREKISGRKLSMRVWSVVGGSHLRWDGWAHWLEVAGKRRRMYIILFYSPLVLHVHAPLLDFQGSLQFLSCFYSICKWRLDWDRRHWEIGLTRGIIERIVFYLRKTREIMSIFNRWLYAWSSNIYTTLALFILRK